MKNVNRIPRLTHAQCESFARYHDDDFIVDVIDNGSEYEFWLGHSDYAISVFQFGMSKADVSYNDFMQIVVLNLNMSEDMYEADHMW